MEIRPAMRVIEVGYIVYAPAMQRTPLATEAQYLLARYAFEELGYRRYEWKCDSLNAPSRRAALRFGFVYEGLFRQHMIYKARNRDTAWYSIIDGEWPARKARLRALARARKLHRRRPAETEPCRDQRHDGMSVSPEPRAGLEPLPGLTAASAVPAALRRANGLHRRLPDAGSCHRLGNLRHHR